MWNGRDSDPARPTIMLTSKRLSPRSGFPAYLPTGGGSNNLNYNNYEFLDYAKLYLCIYSLRDLRENSSFLPVFVWGISAILL